MAGKVINYVGKGKPIGNYDDILFYIDTKKVTPNKNGFIGNLRIKKLREPDKNGMTHTIFVDDFVPTPRQEQKTPGADKPMVDQETLPF